MKEGIKYTLIALATIATLSVLGVICHEFNAGRALQKYEWFKNQHAQIQQIDSRIKDTKVRIEEFKKFNGDPQKWKWNVSDEYNRLQTVHQGYVEQYNYMVAEYNAQSSKFNWELFKSTVPRELIEYK